MSFSVRVESTMQGKNYSGAAINGLKEFLTLSSIRVEGEAKLLAPVDTGEMRNTIFRQVGLRHASIISPAKYSEYVEFGTSTQRAQPFMRTGLDYSMGDIRRFGQQYLLKILRG